MGLNELNMKRKILFSILVVGEVILLLRIFLCRRCEVRNGIIWLLLVGLMILIIVRTLKLYSSMRDWERYIKEWDYPELTFEEFYSLYTVMPENFELNEFSVNYKYKGVSFKTYFDYCKYRKFIKHYKEQKKEMKRTEIQADLIKELQRDLAAKQEENDQWVKENIKKNVHIGQTSF